MQPKIYISHSPGRQGSIFALFYFEAGSDIHGWHIEARSGYFSAAFFMAENFYANKSLHLYRSIEDDVYGPWTIDCPPTRDDIRCPVPASVTHELERAQSQFVEEWLFFPSDNDIDFALSAHEAHEWPLKEVNIKPRRLQRLHKEGDHWTHASAGVDLNVVQLLRKYWRLNEKVPTE